MTYSFTVDLNAQCNVTFGAPYNTLSVRRTKPQRGMGVRRKRNLAGPRLVGRSEFALHR